MGGGGGLSEPWTIYSVGNRSALVSTRYVASMTIYKSYIDIKAGAAI